MSTLHELEGEIAIPSLGEAIRLLESERFDELTSAEVRAIAEYQCIELGSERFFEKAFTPGKEVAASLGTALRVGRKIVLDDLRRLRASLGGETG